MHYVYILKSLTSGQHYIGETKNLTERLKRHNEGRSKSTKGRGPWMIEIACVVEDKPTACKLERKLKNMKNSSKAIEYIKRNCLVVEHSDD